MNLFNVNIANHTAATLDPNYIPMGKFCSSFLKTAEEEFHIGLEGNDGQMSTLSTKIHGTLSMAQADHYYLRRMMKTMLWLYGGFKFHLIGNNNMIHLLKKDFSDQGVQAFDRNYMSNIYEKPFEIVQSKEIPHEKRNAKKIGGNFNGCRIGFDAGGSDRKVSAVINGECVFSEEMVWFPKINSDPDYHFQGITDALRSASAHLPRVDAVGISSAGIYIENRTMSASLFLQVPHDLFENQVKNIYQRAVSSVFGDKIPFSVINDGDVSALAGAINLKKNNVLGIAMGTSQAVGFVDENSCITGWLNELAFVPVDASPSAMDDEWSGDIGCGVKYFSQDAVIKLAPAAGIELDSRLSPAEKLKKIQEEVAHPGSRAEDIYQTIGVYLAHSLAFYYDFYQFESVLLLGRVMSGRGGEILSNTAQSVLKNEYPTLGFSLVLPDETARRVGQSVAAASLPKISD